MRLVPMRKYCLALPAGGGGEAVPSHVVTYIGKFPPDHPCHVCGKEDRGGHLFVEGDPENPKWAWTIGSGCVRKCEITDVEEASGKLLETAKEGKETTKPCWTSTPPQEVGWYWTRCVDWMFGKLLPSEVKGNGDIYSLWGDHNIEWWTIPIDLPKEYDNV